MSCDNHLHWFKQTQLLNHHESCPTSTWNGMFEPFTFLTIICTFHTNQNLGEKSYLTNMKRTIVFANSSYQSPMLWQMTKKSGQHDVFRITSVIALAKDLRFPHCDPVEWEMSRQSVIVFPRERGAYLCDTGLLMLSVSLTYSSLSGNGSKQGLSSFIHGQSLRAETNLQSQRLLSAFVIFAVDTLWKASETPE